MKRNKKYDDLKKGKIAFLKLLFTLNAPWNILKGLASYRPLKQYLVPDILSTLNVTREDWKRVKNLLKRANAEVEKIDDYNEKIKIWLEYVQNDENWH